MAGEPPGVAIIGMACRFPGAPDIHSFWRNLCAGTESITQLSDDDLRAAGVSTETLNDPAYVKAAPLLDDVDAFDAPFFEYSPQEARIMDPQQRLLLQIAWQAFEDAGYRPGGVTGVFVGCGGVVSSYLLDRLLASRDLPGTTGSLAHLGNDKDFASTRISYKLNLTGPSINVQTACSTSLVAVHLACQSILSGECDTALAGASAVRVPQRIGYHSVKGGILSPDGHCRAFDADAAGTVFGSGVGAVLLKEASQAIADGDHIYAVIRGSAVNNDGAGKMSFTASSVPGQARAMVEAMGIAQVDADSIDYVECHGTGTAIGDPLEIAALTRAFRTSTDKRGYCAIGSVKSNIGHLEQCAGMASLIKTALAMHHGAMPPSLHVRAPNPKIDFETSPFFIIGERRDWLRNGHARHAAVNSLGLGGTNAFLVLGEAPETAPPQPTQEAQLFVQSARTEAALAEALDRQRNFLDEADIPLGDLCRTLARGRTHFPHRRAIVAGSVEALRAALAEAGTSSHKMPRESGKLAFLFSGQASQYAGMGAAFYRSEPVFRDAFDRCAASFEAEHGAALADIVFDIAQSERLTETINTQPALYALQVSLAELWRSWGIVPDVVLGHSIGEFAAACSVGALSLEDGFAFVMKRAAAMQALPRGVMASVNADEVTLANILSTHRSANVSIAAVNAPQLAVLSGPEPEVATVLAELERRGLAVQRLSVSHAFHSPMMMPAMTALREHAAAIGIREPGIAWISTLTAVPVQAAPDAEYWCEHALKPVRFRDAACAAVESGVRTFIEIGPGSALLALGRQSCGGMDGVFLPSLKQGKERETMLRSLGALYEQGRDIDWDSFYRSATGRRVSLPTYPFEPHRYWLDHGRAGSPSAAGPHDLTGTRVRSASDEALFEQAYSLHEMPWLDDHRIYGHPVLPFTAGLVALNGAARSYFESDTVTLTDIQYGKALVVPDEEPCIVQSVLSPVDANRADCRLASLGEKDWLSHIHARAEKSDGTTFPAAKLPLDTIRRRCAAEVPVRDYYDFADRLGLNYGAAFRAITSIHRGQGEVLTNVILPAHLDLPATSQHPALLDACLHIYPALASAHTALGVTDAAPPVYLPIGLARFTMQAPPAREVFVHAVRREEDRDARTLTIDITICAADGIVIATMEGLMLKVIPEAVLVEKTEAGIGDWLYRLDWLPLELDPFPQRAATIRASWLILADRDGVAETLAAQLQNRGDVCRMILADDMQDALQSDKPVENLSERFVSEIEQATRTYLPPLHGVIDLWPLDAPAADNVTDLETRQRTILSSAAALFSALNDAPRQRAGSARIFLVTRNAVTADAQDDATDPIPASLWGLGRSAAVEHPLLWGGLIDLDRSFSVQAAAEALLQQITLRDGEDQVALRGDRRFGARLVRTVTPDAPARIDPDGTYLITGGFGSVGCELAKWLAMRHGVKHLTLVSRRGNDDPRAQPVSAELAALGAEVAIHRADVTSESEVEALFATLERSPLPLRGIFHCAGLLDDGILVQLDWERFAKVMLPKTTGAVLLDRLSRGYALDHFVLFSSILGQIGSAGQANYAAANTFLDTLVDRRRQDGLPALGLNWGPWEADGLATASGDKGRALWRNRGTQYIETGQAWAAFDALIGSDVAHATITVTDWPVFMRQFADVPSLYRHLQREAGAPSRGSKPHIDLKPRLAAATSAERRALLANFARDAVTETIGESGAIDPARPLREYGLDSLMSITLINRIEMATGIRIAMTRMIRGPNLDQLVDELALEFDQAAGTPSEQTVVATPGNGAAAPDHGAASPDNGGWLTPITTRARPKFRLFCFPFAGGGSAVYRNWAPFVRPDLELIAIEPPGRLSRIGEEPVSDIAHFVDHVVAGMDGRLDAPFAFFGHCLGGLTMYETLRRLVQTTPFRPDHMFVSGARPPDRLTDQGAFEQRLMRDLMALSGFRVNQPMHAQADDVFSEIIRHFNILASEQLLGEPELRDLMLPIVRAEFRLANNYIFTEDRPFEVPITCFYAHDDPYVTRAHALGWGRFTNSRFQTFVRPGTHFAVVDDMEFITRTINRELEV